MKRIKLILLLIFVALVIKAIDPQWVRVSQFLKVTPYVWSTDSLRSKKLTIDNLTSFPAMTGTGIISKSDSLWYYNGTTWININRANNTLFTGYGLIQSNNILKVDTSKISTLRALKDSIAIMKNIDKAKINKYDTNVYVVTIKRLTDSINLKISIKDSNIYATPLYVKNTIHDSIKNIPRLSAPYGNGLYIQDNKILWDGYFTDGTDAYSRITQTDGVNMANIVVESRNYIHNSPGLRLGAGNNDRSFTFQMDTTGVFFSGDTIKTNNWTGRYIPNIDYVKSLIHDSISDINIDTTKTPLLGHLGTQFDLSKKANKADTNIYIKTIYAFKTDTINKWLGKNNTAQNSLLFKGKDTSYFETLWKFKRDTFNYLQSKSLTTAQLNRKQNKLIGSQSIKLDGDSVALGDTIYKEMTYYLSKIGYVYNQYLVKNKNSGGNQYLEVNGIINGINTTAQSSSINGRNLKGTVLGNNSSNLELINNGIIGASNIIMNNVTNDTSVIIKKNGVNKMVIRASGNIYTPTDTFASQDYVRKHGGGGGSGTVTSITAGTGLSGGTITNYGTIQLDTNYIKLIKGNSNLFTGYQSGYNNTSGNHNLFTGAYSGYYNTTGYANTFSGDASGNKNTTGYGNSFYGSSSGFKNTTGTNNSFTANQSGQLNTTGSNNTFNGGQAGYGNTTGSNNLALGYKAGLNNGNLSNRGYLNVLDNSDLSGDTTKSPIYFYQNSTTSNSRIYLNGKTVLPYQDYSKSDSNNVAITYGKAKTIVGGSSIDTINKIGTKYDLSKKANISSPTFTGTVSGITAAMVGLSNVTNEKQLTKADTGLRTKVITRKFADSTYAKIGSGGIYTFSTGLTNNSSTITNNLSTGVSGTQTLIGSTTDANPALSIKGTTYNATTTNKAINFLVGNNGGTEAMTILNNGKIGIGTNNPAKKLEIVNNGNFDSDLQISNTGTGTSSRSILWLGEDNGSKNMGFAYNNNSYTLGTGFESLAANRAVWYAQGTGGIGIIAYQNAPITFYTKGYGSGNERLRIIGDGNVGIANATPQFILDVNGNTRISAAGNLYFGGTITSASDYISGISATSTTTTFQPRIDGYFDFINAANTKKPLRINTTANRIELQGGLLINKDSLGRTTSKIWALVQDTTTGIIKRQLLPTGISLGCILTSDTGLRTKVITRKFSDSIYIKKADTLASAYKILTFSDTATTTKNGALTPYIRAKALTGNTYTFSGGLTNTANTVTNDLLTATAGSKTIIGGTGINDTVIVKPTTGNGTATKQAINFLVGNNGATKAMTILNSGKIGIGTGSPTRKLEIINNGNFDCDLQLFNNGTGTASRSILWLGEDYSTKNMGFAYFNNSYTLGTGFESLAANRAVWYAQGTGGMGIIASQNAPIVVYTNGFGTASERLRVTGTGNVGIANATPQCQLDINGNTRISGSNTLYFGGTTSSGSDYISSISSTGTTTTFKPRVDGTSAFDFVNTAGTGHALIINTSTLEYTHGGGVNHKFTALSGNQTLDGTYYFVTATGNITITLPTATSITGREYIIKKIDSGTTTTINTTSSQTMDGQLTITLNQQYTTFHFISDGSNWLVY